MTSRAVRLTVSALAILAIGAAAFYVRQTTQQLSLRITAVRQFDARAREATTSITSARAAQRAYIASGQSSSAWMPQVKMLSEQTASGIDALRGLAASTDARQTLLDASASIAEFITIDKQARDYLAADQTLMASDVVFSEGGASAVEIEQQIELARAAEQQAFDGYEHEVRQQQLYAAGGAGLLAALALLVFGLARGADRTTEVTAAAPTASEAESLALEITPAPAAPLPEPQPAITDDAPPREALALNAAAEVSTAFGCVQDLPGLKRALAQASTALDASGMVVWIGSLEGADLRAVVAHGYSDHVLSMMRPVSKQADNAAAMAYRTAKLQIVPAKPGTSLGAVVAPIIAAEGCIGALSAEIRDNGEVADTVHAMATIFASQLAGVLASAATPQHASSRIASA